MPVQYKSATLLNATRIIKMLNLETNPNFNSKDHKIVINIYKDKIKSSIISNYHAIKDPIFLYISLFS